MNQNEVEQWMKQTLGEQPFAAGEDGWSRLQAAIRPAGEERPASRLRRLPGAVRAAAAVLLLLLASAILVVLLRPAGNEGGQAGLAATGGTSQPAAPAGTVQPPAPAAPVGAPAPPVQRQTAAAPPPAVLASIPSTRGTEAPPAAGPAVDTAFPQPLPTSPRVPADPPPVLLSRGGPEADGALDPGAELPPERRSPGFNLGLAAQVGRASVGELQYQVGVVAQQRLSGRFYACATLAVAATEVQYAQQHTFRSVVANAGLGTSLGEKTVEAQYGRSVIALGLAPDIGCRISPRLALSCGLSLYRNLDPSLGLRNAETIAPAALGNGIIRSEQTISSWDAGLTGGASYQPGRRLSVEVRYRHGLSDYMQLSGRPVRNSGMSIGFHYLFGATQGRSDAARN